MIFCHCILNGLRHVSTIIVLYRLLSLPWNCLCSIHASTVTLSNHWSFSFVHSVDFRRLSYSWNQIICSLFSLATFKYTKGSSMSFHGLEAHLLLVPGCNTVLFYFFNIYSHTEGPLDCLQVLVTISKAAINIHGKVFVWTQTFSSIV